MIRDAHVWPAWTFAAVLLMSGGPVCAAENESGGPAADYFGIQVVDEVSGRGVPLVELRTVNEISLVTDNAGWIAFREPGLMNREVFWHVSGPGIVREKDGFGYAGFRATATPGATAEVKVKVTNIASRLGRLTGQGLYRHSALLGYEHPPLNIREPGVTGQDSVQAVPYDGRIFWLWGDTGIERYPLGNFHTTSAFTPRDAHPEEGLRFEYLADPSDPKRLRKMMPSSESGVVWMFGLFCLTGPDGDERLFCGYSRQQGLVPPDERGIAEFDKAPGRFRKAAAVDKDDEWHMPAGCATRVKSPQGEHVYFCTPYAYRRVEATAASAVDPARYETFVFDPDSGEWSWRSAAAATTLKDEERLLKSGTMKPGQARYQLTAADGGEAVRIHTASIRWNAWREKFVLIGVQIGGKDSHLGEVWYAESDEITGPWRKAVKVVSHPDYTYYNPIHHDFFDRDGGRLIYFEGTYTRQFSGNAVATPRYDYNQLMYRLDLSDERLEPAR